jgi:hypothetical protein
MRRLASAVFTVTALTTLATSGRAQAPAVQQYDSRLDVPISWGGEGMGPGFYFSTTQTGLRVTALSYFNPADLGGAAGFPAWSLAGGGIGVYLYALASLPTATSPLFSGTLLASATVTNASPTHALSSGAPGAFFTSTLATPVALAPSTIYGVFGGTLVNGSIAARFTDTPGAVPTTDPRITFLGSGTRWAPPIATWTDFEIEGLGRNYTGASFELAAAATTAPEPGTLGLVVAGVGALLASRRRRAAR